MISYKDIKGWTDKDREVKTRELYKELMKLRSQVAMGTAAEDPGRIRQIKRTLAKILTSQNQKGANKALEEKNKK